MGEPRHFKSLDSFENESKLSVHFAIGMFDGLHLGHRKVVYSAIEAAKAAGGLAGVLTFWPHPSHLFRPDNPVPMILNSRMKFAELDRLEVDFIVEEPFDKAFAALEAEAFVEILKSKAPDLASIHTGANWRFGKGRKGDVELLGKLAKESGIELRALDCLYLDGERVSSTRIREAISDGEVEAANRLLGYTYESIGTVQEGKKVGRSIGAPTLNIPFDGELFPRKGVYFVRVSREKGSERLPAVANFGIRPTVNILDRPVLEAHVLGECPFAYGDTLRVEWEHFSRPERKFESLESLEAQIRKDIENARSFYQFSADG
jgi:riboflavin kinase/FMN adenylyltransferase